MHLRNSVSVKIVKHRNAFVARLARSAYRTKYAHDFSIFSSSFAPRPRTISDKTFALYLFDYMYKSFFTSLQFHTKTPIMLVLKVAW